MKLFGAKFRNFAKFEDFECEFNDQVTRLVGINGSGKSTVGLKGLIACINGIAESGKEKLMGDRFKFIGKAGKSADIEYEFVDESTSAHFWIKNHVTESANKITFRGDGDAPVNEEWLRGFLNVALMSAKNFCSLSGRDQALALGIDASSFDQELAKHKEEFTGLNRDLKAFGELVEPDKIARVDVAALAKKQAEIKCKLNGLYIENRKANAAAKAAHDQALKCAEKKQNEWNEKQEELSARIMICNSSLGTLRHAGYQGEEVSFFIDSLPIPEPEFSPEQIPELVLIEEIPDDSELREVESEILAASDTNSKAEKYDTYLQRVSARDAKIKEIEANKVKQTECITARNKYISSFEFPFTGLATNENGELLLNERPINDSYYSKGELEIIVAKLHASTNPVFKCRFIDDFDLIDEDNQEKIIKELLEAEFQIITAEVAKSSNKENSIVLRECKIVTDEEQKPSLI